MFFPLAAVVVLSLTLAAVARSNRRPESKGVPFAAGASGLVVGAFGVLACYYGTIGTPAAESRLNENQIYEFLSQTPTNESVIVVLKTGDGDPFIVSRKKLLENPGRWVTRQGAEIVVLTDKK